MAKLRPQGKLCNIYLYAKFFAFRKICVTYAKRYRISRDRCLFFRTRPLTLSDGRLDTYKADKGKMLALR